jgi:hypothetical protein
MTGPLLTSSHNRSVRIAPGHHLYPARDGSWRCYGPGDRFIRLRAAAHLMGDLRRVLHRASGVDEVVDDVDTTAQLDSLIAAFAAQGLIDTGAGSRRRAAVSGAVHVEGDNPIGRLVVDVLGTDAAVVHGPINEAAVARSDFVIACAGWLPDARWMCIDRWCSEHAVPWSMCYAEGLAFFVGPCSVPGVTASYTDTRARRLAAAGFPDELLAYWAYLDAGRELPPVPWPSRGGAAVIAGLLAADLFAFLSGAAPFAAGYQLEVDPSDLSIRRHPVLPLPSLRINGRPDDPRRAG